MADIITDREPEQFRASTTEGQATDDPVPARRETLSIAVGAFLLTLAVRLPTIGRQSFWIDEIYTAEAVAKTWSALVADRLAAGHFPTYFLLLKGIGLAGGSEALLRLPSALFESAAAALFALMAGKIGGRIAAAVTAFFFAFLPVLFFYGQEARPYALMLLFLAIMMTGQRTLLIVSSDRSDASRSGAGGLAATLGAIAAALTIPAAIVSIAAAQAGLVLAGALRRGSTNRRDVLRHLMVTWLAIGAAALALVPSVIAEASTAQGLMKWQVADSAADRLLNVWRELFGLVVLSDANIFLPAGWEHYPSLGLMLFAGAGAWIGRRQPAVRYLSGMVVVTLVAFLAIGSFTAIVARYLIGVIPPFLMLVGYAASRVLQHPTWLRPVSAVLLIVIGAMTTLQTLDAFRSNSRYNWTALSRFLRTSEIGDAAVLSPEGQAPQLFSYYQPGTVPPAFVPVLRQDLWRRVPATGTAYVLAFDMGDGVPDGVAAGRTVCRWSLDEATFFAVTPDPASLPAPLRSCAGRLAAD